MSLLIRVLAPIIVAAADSPRHIQAARTTSFDCIPAQESPIHSDDDWSEDRRDWARSRCGVFVEQTIGQLKDLEK